MELLWYSWQQRQRDKTWPGFLWGCAKERAPMKKKQRDEEEKALILLLWGRKGWQGYKRPTGRGFAIERVLTYLRGKKKTAENS
jgi:hypothetical protein